MPPILNTLEKWSSCSHEVGFLSTQRQESSHIYSFSKYLFIEALLVPDSILGPGDISESNPLLQGAILGGEKDNKVTNNE